MIIDNSATRLSNGFYLSTHDNNKFSLTYRHDKSSMLEYGYKSTPWSFEITFFNKNHTHIKGRGKSLKEVKRIAYIYLNFFYNMDEIWKLYSRYGKMPDLPMGLAYESDDSTELGPSWDDVPNGITRR